MQKMKISTFQKKKIFFFIEYYYESHFNKIFKMLYEYISINTFGDISKRFINLPFFINIFLKMYFLKIFLF